MTAQATKVTLLLHVPLSLLCAGAILPLVRRINDCAGNESHPPAARTTVSIVCRRNIAARKEN